MSKNQILASLTEIEKLLKRNEQLIAKTKPTKYLIISSLPLYRLINQTRIPFHRQIGRGFCVFDIELELEKDNEEELEESEQRSKAREQRSEVRGQMSEEKEEEPP